MQLRRAFRIVKGDIIAFVGAGGKTTAISRLADELAADNCRVVITTTTHMYPPTGGDLPVVTGDGDELLRCVQQRLNQVSRVIVASTYVDTPEGTKLAGLRPEFVAALRDSTAADVVLVEADGSRGRPLKAPAAYEPVIPPATTLVVAVAGLSALGRPLSGETVHRPERVAALAGVSDGEMITPEHLANVLIHPEGGLKDVPEGARVVALLNQADDPARLNAGRQVANRLLRQGRFAAVGISALGSSISDGVHEVHERVAAIVLAAGAGRRFGGAKQLALWRGRPLLEHVVEAVLASQVSEVVVVTGYESERVVAAVSSWGLRLRIVMNPNWPNGQSTSVHTGLSTLPTDIGAALFVLADQPRLSPQVINAILQCRRETFAPIVVPTYGGQRSNPVLFDRDLFPELLGTTGDVGGRLLIERHAMQVAWLPFAAELAPGDVDRPEDLREDNADGGP